MKITALSVLFLAAGALAADYKLTYSCYNKKGGTDGKGGNEAKAAGKVEEALAKKIHEHMDDWSHNKYKGKINDGRHTITVVCNTKADNKKEALDAIEAQAELVKEHKGN